MRWIMIVRSVVRVVVGSWRAVLVVGRVGRVDRFLVDGRAGSRRAVLIVRRVNRFLVDGRVLGRVVGGAAGRNLIVLGQCWGR